MRSAKVLEMLENGQIEELKSALRDDIYQESLKKRPNAKRRYSAMKKYSTYAGAIRETLRKPCEIEFEGEKYISFCNSYSLAFTTESIGELELFDEPDRYPQVTRLISFDGEERKLDIRKIIAEAKSLGYRVRKTEYFSNKFLLKYDGAYFRIILLDTTFSIIDDGEIPTVYHVKDSVRPLVIKNNLGVCMIMPVRYSPEENGDEPSTDDTVIIEVDMEGE